MHLGAREGWCGHGLSSSSSKERTGREDDTEGGVHLHWCRWAVRGKKQRTAHKVCVRDSAAMLPGHCPPGKGLHVSGSSSCPLCRRHIGDCSFSYSTGAALALRLNPFGCARTWTQPSSGGHKEWQPTLQGLKACLSDALHMMQERRIAMRMRKRMSELQELPENLPNVRKAKNDVNIRGTTFVLYCTALACSCAWDPAAGQAKNSRMIRKKQ